MDTKGKMIPIGYFSNKGDECQKVPFYSLQVIEGEFKVLVECHQTLCWIHIQENWLVE